MVIRSERGPYILLAADPSGCAPPGDRQMINNGYLDTLLGICGGEGGRKEVLRVLRPTGPHGLPHAHTGPHKPPHEREGPTGHQRAPSLHGPARPGSARPGLARPGPARPGPAHPGPARAPTNWRAPTGHPTGLPAGSSRLGPARLSPTGPGPARPGPARPGSAHPGPARAPTNCRVRRTGV